LQFGLGEYWLTGSQSTNEDVHVPPSSSKAEQWVMLKAIRANLPIVIDSYLSTVEFKDEGHKSALQALQYDLQTLEPYFQVQDELNNHQSLAAYHKLEKLSQAGVVRKNEFFFLPLMVFQQLIAGGMNSEALDVLDIYTTYVRKYGLYDQSFRDFMRTKYRLAGNGQGDKRYQLMLKREGTDNSVVKRDTKSKELLSGSYKNLSTGNSIDLSTLLGQMVVIDFWATWCGPCVTEIPDVRAFAAKVAKTNDVAFISVDCDLTIAMVQNEEYVRGFVSNQGIKYPVLLDVMDNSIAKRFDISFLPNKIVLDKQGRVILGPPVSVSFDKIDDLLSHSDIR
jgi:thiol-disulfide isomerase/thioredoxin